MRILFIIIINCIAFQLLSQHSNSTIWKLYGINEKVKKEDIIHSLIEKKILNSEESLHLIDVKEKNNISHYYYQQFFSTYPIDGAYFVCHTKQNNVVATSNNIVSTEDLPVSTPSVSKEEAINIAIEHLGANVYAWEDEAYERMIQNAKNNPHFSFYPQPQLLYYRANHLDQYQLVYYLEISSLKPTGWDYLYIDANSGQIIHHIDKMQKACTSNSSTESCNGNTLYYGNQNFNTNYNNELNDPIYELIQCDKGISTFILPDGQESYSMGVIGEDDNCNFLNFTTSAQQAALAAHWGTELVYDFFASLGYDSYDDNGAEILSYVNYGDDFNSRNNAFWNGSVLTYGAGPISSDTESSVFIGQVISTDIIAHEYGHALTNGLSAYSILYQGESGAIHESYSDIIAAVFEYYLINDLGYSGDITIDEWIMGEACAEMGGNEGIRSFSDPNIFFQPDSYEGTYWMDPNPPYNQTNDYGGVHINSGVMNHWFYLLVNGGVDINIAFQIILESYNYIPNNTPNFLDMRNATILASELLYDCTYTQAIIDAWDAVNVGEGIIFGSCVLIATIDAPQTQVCIGEPITYSSASGSDFTEEWFLNGTATSNPIIFPFEGEHILTLQITDENEQSDTYGLIASTDITIYVTACQPVNDEKGFMYFGYGNGLDFSSGIAQHISYPHYNQESNICQVDENGEILFYTASETTNSFINIYDANHNIIADLFPISSSSKQIGASVPSPNGDQFVLIMNASSNNTAPALRQGLYRQNLNYDNTNNSISSNGPLEAILPPSNGFTYAVDDNGALRVLESTVVIPSCNDQSFWVIVNTTNIVNNPNHTLIYQLDFSTNSNGDINYIGMNEDSYTGNPYVVSPDGDILVSNKRIYSFDRDIGEITFQGQQSNLSSRYGAFSADGRYLYKQYNNYIIQVDLSDLSNITTTSIANIPLLSSFSFISFILGPDDKIYFLYRKSNSEHRLGVINYPEENAQNGNVGCNISVLDFEDNNVPVFPEYLKGEIPSPSNQSFSTLQTGCLDIQVTAPPCLSGYSWDFGDGNILSQGNEIENHSYLNPGTYTITLSSQFNGNTIQITDIITVGWTDDDDLEIIGPTTFCHENFGFFVAPDNYSSYQWSVTDGTVANITNTSDQSVYVTWGNDINYTLQVELTDENGCTNVLSLDIIYDCIEDPCSNFPCGNNNNKVIVCHIPDENPSAAFEICISPNAVQAHLEHGDYCGPCNETENLDPLIAIDIKSDREMDEKENRREYNRIPKIYPNPNNGLFSIQFNSNEEVEVQIIDLKGIKLVEFDNSHFKNQSLNVDISHYPTGMYFVQIKLSHKVMTKKIIISQL